MKTLLQAGARVQQAFERHEWLFCFIGGVANFRWGTPRLTNDLDLTLLTGFGLDIALGAMPFEASAIERSSNAELVPGATLRTCSAEDLIVHKAFAARPQDWVDVEGVILKQRGQLAWPQVWSDLAVLAQLKGAPELVDELERIARRAEAVIGEFPRGR